MKTIKVERIPTSDEWKRTVSANLELGRAQRTWHQLHPYRFPLRTRYQIVCVRWMHPRTWRERWHDLVYLVRG